MTALYVLIIYVISISSTRGVSIDILTQIALVMISVAALTISLRSNAKNLSYVFVFIMINIGLIRNAYPSVEIIPIEWYERLESILSPFKSRMIYGLSVGMDEAKRELIGGIVLGRGSGVINVSEWTHFIKSGMSHLLVASGAQVSLCVFPLLILVEKVRMSIWARRVILIFTGLMLISLVVIVGVEPSILRAVTACYFYIFARMISRRVHSLNIIYVTALFWLFLNPSLLENIGFQLSYFASWGLIYIYPKLRIIVPSFRTRLKWPIANEIFQWIMKFGREIALLSFSAQIAVTPILAYHFHRFSMSGIIANIVALPISQIIIHMGLISSVVAQIFPAVAIALNHINELLLTLLDNIAHIFSYLPYIYYPLNNIFELFLPYILLMLTFEARFRPERLINAIYSVNWIIHPRENIGYLKRMVMRRDTDKP